MCWQRFYHRLFVEYMNDLFAVVEHQKQTNPRSFTKSEQSKLLASIIEVIDLVAEDPTRREFLLGNTIGKEHRDWRRVKKYGLPPRYRLFFKFFLDHKEIYYAWINGLKNLRHDGSMRDVYYAFKTRLSRGEIESSRDNLQSSCSKSLTTEDYGN